MKGQFKDDFIENFIIKDSTNHDEIDKKKIFNSIKSLNKNLGLLPKEEQTNSTSAVIVKKSNKNPLGNKNIQKNNKVNRSFVKSPIKKLEQVKDKKEKRVMSPLIKKININLDTNYNDTRKTSND